MGADEWEWFCGVNSSDLAFFHGFAWNEDHIANNTCFTDALDATPHAAFLLIFSLLLLIMGCCTGFRNINTRYLLRYDGHTFKWILMFLLLITHLTSIAEGILTDELFVGQPTQPHFYTPSILAFVTAFVSLVFYHNMELWQCASMSLVLIFYWVVAILGEVAVLFNLISMGQTGYDVMRFDLTVLTLVIYGLILILELNIVRVNMCGCCDGGREKGLPRDLKGMDMYYMDWNVNLLSQVTYWWLNWLLRLGYKRPLEMSDLGALPLTHEANYNHNKFRDAFEKEKESKAKEGKKPSMFRVYLSVYGRINIWAGLVKLVGDAMGYIGPLCVGAITLYVTELQYPSGDVEPAGFISFSHFFANGFVLVGVMFLAATIKCVSLQTHYHMVILESLHVRTALQTMVYEKSLRLSTYATTGGMMTMGQITNHMSTDAMSLLFCFQMMHYCWSIPLQIVITLVLLYQQLGWSALIGAAVFVVLLPFQMKIAGMMSKLQKETLLLSDQRLKLSNELLQGIKLLKLYGWEELYCKAIEAVRVNELWAMFKINGNIVATMLITSAGPILVTLVSFGTYTFLTGKPLTPDVAFSSLSFFNQLTIPLFLLPMTLATMVNAVVSSNRLLNFFMAPEVETAEFAENLREETDGYDHDNGQLPAVDFRQPSSSEKASLLQNEDKSNHHSNGYGSLDRRSKTESAPSPVPDDVAVKIVNGNFTWDENSNLPVISKVNVEIPAGKLTMVVGQVGSGKSSFCSAILGEMTTMSGSVLFNSDRSSIAYAAQKAWLLNATLKDNIIFSEETDSRRYRRVLKACALEPDIEILPGGDQTEIGEKGINLSGGQKQRVSVARAMYSTRDIIILDDPLSALDVHVGRTLFEEGIMNLLIKNKKTVVLVTHQLQYLQEADMIIVMQDGFVQHQGTLDEIAAADPELYKNWRDTANLLSEAENEDPSATESESESERRVLKRQISRQLTVEEEEKKKIASQYSRTDSTSEKQSSEEGQLIEKEEMERGSVSYKVYLYYLSAITYPIVFIVLFFILSQSGLRIVTNFWLSAWSESNLNITGNDTAEDDLGFWIGGYAGLSFGTIITQLLSSTLLVVSSLIAARRLHLAMLHTIIRVPMRFFDTTPTGRIMNRFSNDTQLIDMRLINTLNGLIGSLMNCLSAIIVNAIVTPIFLAVVAPVSIAYVFLQNFFITSSRELQRLDSVTKSPVFAYFSETLTGLATIRAYKTQKRFYRTIMERINVNNTAYLYLQTANRWLGVRLDFIGAIIVLLAGLTTSISAVLKGTPPSEVGLAISYALQVSGYLNWVVRSAADTEMQMNAVERVQFYSSLSREKYEGLEPPPNWPHRGQISVDSISVRYASDLDPVLRDVSVNIRAGEKVGICGRTGSGKSSLTLALFRIIDIFKGRILIDGIDVATVPLTVLRQRLSIIPQDPVLFTGTIRRNLDPESRRTDQELWEALEIAQLKEVVGQLEEGLESKVTEGGENYSVGQRQLFCLARAFLRNSQILIMDEATASIDMQTDQILQDVVATAFAQKTVLTIAHRIATILNSDSILVLSDGEVIEYDSPDNLLSREDSVFSSLVKGSQ
ncbi:ATP-binding cassette sub-family C member 9-like [Diadema antillarum]|uniref:ATP-binding cassette sub-family C member 9-like n=1 Tax=Diadema antillarum TaxID=105358 RepID=UPI003A889174